jgi:uncharacterized membrane protein
METQLWAIGLVLVACIVGAFGPIFLKKASGKISLKLKSIIYNKYLIIGIIFYGLSTILFIPALKGGELSVLYPFVATVYIWVSLLSVKMLNEKMNKFKWLGILLIIIGVIFIGIGS